MKFFLSIHYVEHFHLLFLSMLGRKLDKNHYVLKGGCNLRFFYGSPRYSEDMDLDVLNVSVPVLRDRVNGILTARPLRQILLARGIEIEHVTEHKQTETTQRWKLGLRVHSGAPVLATKIEFSRRPAAGPAVFESMNPVLIRWHEISPLMVNHYTREAAFGQKLEALIARSAPQARDVFDLHLLLSGGAKTVGFNPRRQGWLTEAKSRILAMEFAIFKSQVIAFLADEDQAPYDSEDVWDRMRLEVITALEGISL